MSSSLEIIKEILYTFVSREFFEDDEELSHALLWKGKHYHNTRHGSLKRLAV